MKVKYYIKNVDGLVLPIRANETDAGYDVVATSTPTIVGNKKEGTEYYTSISYIEYETNLYLSPEYFVICAGKITNYHTDLRPRSSVSKYNLVLANSVGLIDRGYKNQVLCRFKYIWQPCDFHTIHHQSFMPKDDSTMIGQVTYGVPDMEKIYKKGDKIAQILAIQTLDIEFEKIDELPGVDRGGGFGSTG